MSVREQAREAALKATTEHYLNAIVTDSVNAANDVWEAELREIREVLTDESTAPMKRISTALVYFREALDE